jgi:hypothetical protein
MPFEPGSFSLGALGGTIIGAFVGHFLTKDREQAIAFNERSEELFVSISKHVEGTGCGIHIEDKTRLLIEPYIFVCKREGFRQAVKNYNAAQNGANGIYDPVTGSCSEPDKGKVNHYHSCAEKLLSYLKRR